MEWSSQSISLFGDGYGGGAVPTREAPIFLMKRWCLSVLLLSTFCFGCVTNGRFDLHVKKHLKLANDVQQIRNKQVTMLSQLTRLQVQLQKLDQIFAQFRKKGQYSFANIGVKLDELRTHHQELLGNFQILKLAHDKLIKQHQKLLEDYKRRFGDPMASNAGGNQVDIKVLDPPKLYKLAKDLFDQGKYVESREHLKTLVKRFKAHELTDDAFLLIGQCFEKTNKVYEAILWYNDALKKFPNGDQVDHALLKLGTAHYKINACPEGRAFLRRLVRKHSRSKYASKARKLIRNMRRHCRKR
ncbi:MAG: tetratricopeptide repeat protein [Deltaproteobacteria bacterium]|nr:MAG: tetratricopeptide repeat protein [Deltaproteobacteria bacterium]